MSDVNAIQFLSRSNPGDQNLLSDKIYNGSVATALRESVRLFGTPAVSMRQLSSGRVDQFITFADIPDPEQEYQPGNELLGQGYAFDEVLISVDRPIVAHQYIPYDEYRQSPFNVVGQFGRAHGSKIGRELDKRCVIMAANAARRAAVNKAGLNVHLGGTRVTRAGSSTTPATALNNAYPLSPLGAQRFREDLRTLRRRMAEKNHAADGLIPALATHYVSELLAYDNGLVWGTPSNTATPGGSTLFSSDYGNNSLHQRRVVEIEGFAIQAYVNDTANGGPMPVGQITGLPSKYNLNFAPGTGQGFPIFIALCPPGSAGGRAAVGGVMFDNITSIGPIDQPTKMSMFVRSHAFCGFDVLDPWMAGSIEVTNS